MNAKDLRAQRALLIGLLNSSRAQRRARGVKKSKVALYDELGLVEHLIDLQDTSFSPLPNGDRGTGRRQR